MSRKVFMFAVLIALLIGSTNSAQAAPPSGKDSTGPVEVSAAVYSDVSGPLSDLVGVAPAAPDEKEKKEKPLRSCPTWAMRSTRRTAPCKPRPGHWPEQPTA